MKSLEKPQPVIFKVYRKGGEQIGQINRRLSWDVQPVENPLMTLLTLNYGKEWFVFTNLKVQQNDGERFLILTTLHSNCTLLRISKSTTVFTNNHKIVYHEDSL